MFILSYNRPADAFRLHPTQKPEDLLSYLINKSSKENDIILDSFCGSGSTLISCLENNRKFLGIEIDKKYYNIAKERINKWYQND